MQCSIARWSSWSRQMSRSVRSPFHPGVNTSNFFVMPLYTVGCTRHTRFCRSLGSSTSVRTLHACMAVKTTALLWASSISRFHRATSSAVWLAARLERRGMSLGGWGRGGAKFQVWHESSVGFLTTLSCRLGTLSAALVQPWWHHGSVSEEAVEALQGRPRNHKKGPAVHCQPAC